MLFWSFFNFIILINARSVERLKLMLYYFRIGHDLFLLQSVSILFFFFTWRRITCVVKRASLNNNTVQMKHAQENTETLLSLVTFLHIVCERTVKHIVGLRLGQCWGTCGMSKDFLGTRYSLLSQFLFIYFARPASVM